MKIIVVCDEKPASEYLFQLLKKAAPSAEIVGFTQAAQALAFLTQESCDIAFWDMEMHTVNMLNLAKKCKELYSNLNIIFVGQSGQYAMDAIKLHISGYLLKPVQEKDLCDELDNLRYPILFNQNIVKIQTFGRFEIFVDNRPLSMPIVKCRECLAFLVDRKGMRTNTAELAAVLYENVPYTKRVQNNIYRVISDTLKYLREAGVADIITKTRHDMYINIDKIDCDYYRFLNGDISQIRAFKGKYMTNYSWAEPTLASLLKIKKQK